MKKILVIIFFSLFSLFSCKSNLSQIKRQIQNKNIALVCEHPYIRVNPQSWNKRGFSNIKQFESKELSDKYNNLCKQIEIIFKKKFNHKKIEIPTEIINKIENLTGKRNIRINWHKTKYKIIFRIKFNIEYYREGINPFLTFLSEKAILHIEDWSNSDYEMLTLDDGIILADIESDRFDLSNNYSTQKTLDQLLLEVNPDDLYNNYWLEIKQNILEFIQKYNKIKIQK